MSVLTDAVARAPHAPGVYFFLGAERELLYVGKAVDLRRRLGNHSRDAGRTTDLRRHVLLDRVRTVRWETCADDAAASAREADLVVMLRSAFNASHAEQRPDLYLVLTGSGPVAFELTPAATGRAYGTFPHLAKGATSPVAKRTKGGFTALLRLLWAAGARNAPPPARIAGASPPARVELPLAWAPALLHEFLSGRGTRVLTALERASAAGALPDFTRFALRRDVDAAGEFFALGPRALRRFRLRHRLAPGPVNAATMSGLLLGELRESVGELRPGVEAAEPGLPGRRAARERELRRLLRG